MARKKLTAMQALSLIEEIAESVSFDRLRFSRHKKPRVIREDTEMTFIFKVAHAVRAARTCPHRDWMREAVEIYNARIAEAKP